MINGVEFTCPGRALPQPPDAPYEGYVACYRAGHDCGHTSTETILDDGRIEQWGHCPCCGVTHWITFTPPPHLDESSQP